MRILTWPGRRVFYTASCWKRSTNLRPLQLMSASLWVWDLQCKLIFTSIECWIKQKDVYEVETGLFAWVERYHLVLN